MPNSHHHFALYLVPGFSLVALSCVIDTLRAANVDHGGPYYRWTLIGHNTNSVASSSGIAMSCSSHEQIDKYQTLIICGGDLSHLYSERAALLWLSQQSRTGAVLGSISDGAYVAAAAGLFDKCRSTIHWKCQSAYRERFPRLDVRMSILEVDGNRFSCAGGTASLDLMLKFVADDLGGDVASRIADNYFHDVIRGDDQVQHMTSAFRYAAKDSRLSQALLLMEENLEDPLEVSDIAAQLDLSHRQLDRIFQDHLRTSPSAHYRSLRLLRADGLLKQSELNIGEIALGCGFQSASHLSRHFKRQFGMTPSAYRRSR